MRVTLDGAPAAFGWSGCATVGEVVARAGQALALQERVVSSMDLDGAPADLQDPSAWSSRPADAVGVLALGSAPLSGLILETLDELRSHFPPMRKELESAASSLRSGREAQALESLARIASLWEACLSVGRDVTAGLVPEGDRTLEDQLERLRAAVAPLEEALRRKDYALVADLCAYELPSVVDQWEAAIASWRALAAARG